METHDSIETDSKPAKSQDIVGRQILDEFLIVPISRTAGEVDSIYTLNEVAAFIWELLDGKTSVAEIIKRVEEEFDVESETAASDILELLGKLNDIGIVKGV